jgi:hypothetical protein
MYDDDVETLLVHLIAPDVLTPVQYFEGARAPKPEADAVKRLMLAVLEDALRCYQRYAERPNSQNRRDLAQAESWMFDRNAEGPFAFRHICETLGTHPDNLRHGISQWRLQFGGINARRIGRRSTRRSQPMTSVARNQMSAR